MRIKRLNDATVAAESPPSEHEQIFDLSQVIRSVGEELQTHKRKLVLMIFILFPLYSSQFFIVSCSPECVVPSSPGAAVEADCQECTLNSGNCPALSARCRPETEPAKLQTPAARRREEPETIFKAPFLQPSHKLIFCNPQSFLKEAICKNLGLNSISQKETLTWSPLLSACSLSTRKKETSFGGETELKGN